MYSVVVVVYPWRLFGAENAEPFIKWQRAFSDSGRKFFFCALPCLVAFGRGFWRDGWEYYPPEVTAFGGVKFSVNQVQ